MTCLRDFRRVKKATGTERINTNCKLLNTKQRYKNQRDYDLLVCKSNVYCIKLFYITSNVMITVSSYLKVPKNRSYKYNSKIRKKKREKYCFLIRNIVN